MFVLITYDVNITSPHGEKRLRNVARVCLNYAQFKQKQRKVNMRGMNCK